MRRPVRRSVAAFALAAVAACDGCSGCITKAPPDAYDIERLANPYDQRSGTAAQDPVERAARLVDTTAAELGYGKGPGNVLRLRRDENWVPRVTALLSLGGREALEAAHIDLVDSFTEAFRVPDDVKLELRRSESRLQEAFADPIEDDLRLRTLVAEITWCLYVIAGMTPDAG